VVGGDNSELHVATEVDQSKQSTMHFSKIGELIFDETNNFIG